jgi:hypothetical protein
MALIQALRACREKFSSPQFDAGKNIFQKAVDHFCGCNMVFIPLAPLPSGIDLKRISKNDSHKAETSRVTPGSQ